MTKAALLLDVDGPLNAYTARDRSMEGRTIHQATTSTGETFPVRMRASDGPDLLNTGCELIWATTWEDDANKAIGPLIGLPNLPVIDWIDRDHWNPERLYWKTKRIVSWMNENRPGIPFLWLDDEVTKRDRVFIEENCAEGSGILLITPRYGLEEGHFERIEEWKNEINS
jgi:hypothetical protein